MKTMIRNLLLIIGFLLCAHTANADGRGMYTVKLAFYNVENFYDTVPSMFYDDADFTPRGRRKWDTAKYRTKLANLSRVIDHLDADLLGLAEVENEQVLRDLVSSLKTDYNYMFKKGGDRRGMNLALLYKGDKFVPENIHSVWTGSGREALYVEGELHGRQIGVVICHLPSRLNSASFRRRTLQSFWRSVNSLHPRGSDAGMVIMGDFNMSPAEKMMRRTLGIGRDGICAYANFFTPFATAARKGYGSYAYDDRWHMLDNIFLSGNMVEGPQVRYKQYGIFLRDYMIGHSGRRRNYPLRTYSGGIYEAGYSDHLPVYVILEVTGR